MNWQNHFNASPTNNHLKYSFFWPLLQFSFFVQKATTAGIFLHFVINSLGRYHTWTRRVSMPFANIFSPLGCRSAYTGEAFWRKSAYLTCLISFRQFAQSKGNRREKTTESGTEKQPDREGKEERARRSEKQPRVKKPRGCRSCQIHSPARVILSQSSQLGDSPWSGEPKLA